MNYLKSITTVLVIFTLLISYSCKKEDLKTTHKNEFQAQQMEEEGKDEMPIVKSPFNYCIENANPIGGGIGYNSIVTSHFSYTHMIVSPNGVAFKSAIENASAGMIFFIDPNLSIDMSGLGSVKVPGGVTLASTRGLSGSNGALIFTNDVTGSPLFLVNGDGVRFTGLRIKGPSGIKDVLIDMRGIATYGFDHLKVDNCEIFNFPRYALSIGHSSHTSLVGNEIFNNYIHNNQQKGTGYGVVLNRGYAKIYGNIFQHNRHDIAGSGAEECGYEAACNTVLEGRGYNFDMHSKDGEDTQDPSNVRQAAGKFIYIHHNDFEPDCYDNDRGHPAYNIAIRGRPSNQCRVENNRFTQDGPAQAIGQGFYKGGNESFGNMLVWNNIYGKTSYLGWYVKSNWSSSNPNNFMNVYSNNSNTYLNINDNSGNVFGAETELYIEDCRIQIPYAPPQNEMLGATSYSLNFGDFDGDGNTDIFKLENGKLFVLPYVIPDVLPVSDPNSGYNTSWKYVNTTVHNMSKLRFGFFDGDNITDMIVKDGNDLLISKGCNTSWQYWNTTAYSLLQLRYGDFNGDGQTDLFKSIANWAYSDAGSSSWISLNSSVYTYNDLRLGFFNITNKSDVFLADGTNFQVSYEGVSNWNNLITSGFTTTSNKLKCFDFNGDGISDVLNDFHEVSFGGSSTWSPTTTSNVSISSFPYGNF